MSQTFTFEAIGTQFWIEIFDEVHEHEHTSIKDRCVLICSGFNLKYSRFLSDSDISVLNRERRLENPSAELVALLSYGKQLYVRSETTFNILTGHIVEARGYDASYSFVPTEDLDTLSMGNPVTDLMIDEHEIVISCGNVDLGGYGKGWLIDLIAKDFLEHNIRHFLINGGGDMYGTSDNGEPITIYLEHPLEDNAYLAETTLLNQGFAASSPFKRQWKVGDITHTHIVTKGEVPQLATFAKAASATDADAFATVCLLLPEDQLPVIAAREDCAFARFNPATNQLWQTRNF